MNLGLRKRLYSTIYKNILITFQEKVAVIQLNRPKALNSLNSELMNELRNSLLEIEMNNSLSCVVLTGDSKSFAGKFLV